MVRILPSKGFDGRIMIRRFMWIQALVAVLCLVEKTQALEEFQLIIPNGKNVRLQTTVWKQVGHMIPSGGASAQNLNLFGKAVQNALNSVGQNQVWQEICDLDSDGDGVTNGAELGDPDCQWSSGDPDPTPSNGLFATHPGFDDNATDLTFDASPPTAFVAHATLMCLAWVIFAPVGICSAMTGKLKHPKTHAMAKHGRWFKLHKVCVGTAVYFTLLAYVIMVNNTGEFIKDSAHTRAGTGVIILCFLQPLNGFWRVHISSDGSKSKLRLVWEFFHQWTGRLTVFLAVLAIYFGFELTGDEFGYIKEDTTEALKVLVVVLFGLGSLTSLLYIFLFRKDYRPTSTAQKIPRSPRAVSGNGANRQQEKQNPASGVPEVSSDKQVFLA